jgi:membrane protein YqaA with SNARE-associated domain
MLTRLVLAVAAPEVARHVRHWIFQLGGIGLIPLGILDSSVIPLPGSMDVLTIVLSARDAKLWWYYALMATLGSLIGGFLTFRIARKGGKETLKRKFPRANMEKVSGIFARWGFASVAIAALLPPPAPMVPFVIVAGAMQYPTKKFVGALALGRVIRYTTLALLAAKYGGRIIRVFTHQKHPYIYAAAGVAAVAGLVLFLLYSARRKKHAIV